jgi:hypothetical protein
MRELQDDRWEATRRTRALQVALTAYLLFGLVFGWTWLWSGGLYLELSTKAEKLNQIRKLLEGRGITGNVRPQAC